MAAQNSRGDQIGDFCHFITAPLDSVQGLKSNFKVLLVLLVPLRDAGVEVPTVIVEARGRGDEGCDLVSRLLLEVHESHDNVSDLNAGVVDVVLDVDGVSGSTEEADKGIAQDGVAQMADVGGLVGIDAGVLDEDLAFDVSGTFAGVIEDSNGSLGSERTCGRITLEAGVDVPGAGDLEFVEAIGYRHLRDDCFGDLAWSLAEPLGQLKGERHGELAHFDLGRGVDDDVG